MRRTLPASRLGGTLAVVLVAVACGAEPPQDPDAISLAFETVLETTHSGLDEPFREVVRDAGRFGEVWARIHRSVRPAPAAPEVDFSRQMVIVAGLGTRRSSGFDVGIRSVVVRDRRLEVEVRETCPAPGGFVGMALTRPVHVVRLDKVPHEAGFRDVKAPSCE